MLLEIDGTLIFAAISFIVFVGVMNLILYKPMKKVIDERENFYVKNQATTEKSKQKAVAIVETKEKEIIKSKLEASALLKEANINAQKEKHLAFVFKKHQVDEAMQKSSSALTEQKTQVKTELKAQVQESVNQIVSNILGKEINNIQIDEARINNILNIES